MNLGALTSRHYQLVVGRDIITHINGVAVTSYDEFLTAVRSSPVDMLVRVYDTATASFEDYDVRLRE